MKNIQLKKYWLKGISETLIQISDIFSSGRTCYLVFYEIENPNNKKQ